MGTRKNKRRVKRYSKNTKKRITGGKRKRQARKQTKRYNRRKHSRRQRGGNGERFPAPRTPRDPLVVRTPRPGGLAGSTLTPGGGGGGGGGGTSDSDELELEIGVIPERLRPRSDVHPHGNMELFTSPAPWVDFRDPRHRQPSLNNVLFDHIDSIRKLKGIADTDLYHTFDKHGKVSVRYKGDPKHRVFLNDYVSQNFKPWFDKWLRDRYGGDEHAGVEWVSSDNSQFRRGGRLGRWEQMAAPHAEAAAAAPAAAAEKPESCMVCGDDAHPGTLPCCGAPIPVCDKCIRPLASMATVECPLCRSVEDKGPKYRNWIEETVRNLPAAAAAKDTGEAKRNVPALLVADATRSGSLNPERSALTTLGQRRAQRIRRFLGPGGLGFDCSICGGLGDTPGADLSGRLGPTGLPLGKFSICDNCKGSGIQDVKLTKQELTNVVSATAGHAVADPRIHPASGNSRFDARPGIPTQNPDWPSPPYAQGFELPDSVFYKPPASKPAARK